MRDEFYFPSKDGNTEIHTVIWKPEGEVKAVVQLVHGMVEYIERYDEFARYLSDRGVLVVGNDHLGHGKSVQNRSEYGYFHKKNGNACLIADIHTLRLRMAKKYPNVPYFMLGHSMGSILMRQYVMVYGNGLAGVLLLGVVAEQPKLVLEFGRLLCKTIGMIKGDHHRSKLVDYMVTGTFNKKFKPALTRADWVTSDAEKLDQYVNDPLCSFVFTVNAYYHMLGGLMQISQKESAFMIPKNLPILLAAGSDDPCGNFGKGVRQIYERYKKAGIEDVTLRLYSGDRHEILNETDRDQVYVDLYEWIDNREYMK